MKGNKENEVKGSATSAETTLYRSLQWLTTAIVVGAVVGLGAHAAGMPMEVPFALFGTFFAIMSSVIVAVTGTISNVDPETTMDENSRLVWLTVLLAGCVLAYAACAVKVLAGAVLPLP